MRTISFIRVEFFYVEMALIEETFRDIIVRMLHLVLEPFDQQDPRYSILSRICQRLRR